MTLMIEILRAMLMIIPPYISSSNLDAVINKLEESTNNLRQWFRNKWFSMKANADKCHLPVTGNYAASLNTNEFNIYICDMFYDIND